MIDIDALIADVTIELSSDWTVRRAWTMAPVDDESLPEEVPIMAFYRGTEVGSPRNGSPCFQELRSALIAVYIVKQSDETLRIKEARKAIVGWQKANDRECLELYLSDDAGAPSGPIQITGQYIWQKDVWLTKYPLIAH